MPTRLRRLAVAETVVAALAALLGAVTVVWRDWIEVVFAVEPDGGDGGAEWLVVVGLFAVAVVLGLLARRHLRLAAAA